jgi:uncharacterized protein (DUF488 family)
MQTIYTIGHGRQAIEEFIGNLKRHGVALVCDVRSAARSRWPQFNGPALERALAAAGIGYEHLPECGGKIIAPPEELARGLDRIIELAGEAPIALMCSEGRPLTTHATPRANCHRVAMLSIPLKKRGANVVHILPGGEITEIDEERVPSEW